MHITGPKVRLRQRVGRFGQKCGHIFSLKIHGSKIGVLLYLNTNHVL